MDHTRIVRDAVKELGFLDEGGQLMPLDSISVVQLVTALEQSFGVEFPIPELRPENFDSIETIAELARSLLAR